ncbi:CD1247 N-terminal domain-containing protein [Desulforudis sp. 1088]|uniref:CD1247 N-terminal domain-containing protein n=1 Tax=unclassified Candidatus Desulforudis TaxID=2635950 RepID=UPI0034934A9A
MSDLKAKVAYLEGLAAGLNLPEDSKEGKLLDGIVEVLGEFADAVDNLEDAQDSLEDYLESIDEDLYNLETQFNRTADEDAGYYEVECPKCEHLVCVDSEVFEDGDVESITCPNCDEAIMLNGEASHHEHMKAD